MAWPIRPARRRDSRRFQEIEASTHEQFRAIGLAIVADDPPDPVDVLDAYADAGRSWVAVDDRDEAAGYVLVDVVDDAAHIAQVTVMTALQGYGIGRALIEEVKAWARHRGLPAVTLTTFSDVPWNRPLYEHLGFRVLTEDEIGPELRAVENEEAAKGFEPGSRVAMRIDLAR